MNSVQELFGLSPYISAHPQQCIFKSGFRIITLQLARVIWRRPYIGIITSCMHITSGRRCDGFNFKLRIDLNVSAKNSTGVWTSAPKIDVPRYLNLG